MPTTSYAPFQAELRIRESKTTCIMESEFGVGVGGWRKSNGVGIGVGIGVEVFEISNFC